MQTMRERKFLDTYRRLDGDPLHERHGPEPEQRMESATNWLLILLVAVAVGVAAVWVGM